MIPVIFGVALLTFILFTFFGEDPVRMALGQHATPEAMALLRQKWGLDKNLFRQFIDFLLQIITLDFGRSYSSGETLTQIFKQGSVVSLLLTVPPFIIGTTINLLVSMLISFMRESWLDKASRFIFIGSMSVSYLVYIIFFQYFLAYKLGWFPIQGFSKEEAILYLLLPWIIIIVVSAGPDIRLYRTIFLDENKAEYIKTARAKGSSEFRVLFIHIFKNALIPVITHTLVSVPYLITGAFVMERYFGLPGIGDLTITAINEGDFPIIKGMTIILAILFSLFNLFTDILYAFVDPRVKFE